MTLLLFLVILSVLVFVHELGHFFTAKKNGIYVEEFGFGLPPRIWGKKIGETIYSVNLLPIGGFVKLFGEDQADISKTRNIPREDQVNKAPPLSNALPISLDRAFFTQKKRIRAIVLTAGVIMNFLLGVTLFSVIYTVVGIPTQTDEVSIVEVLPNSPAEVVGLKTDEVVFALDGEVIESTAEFVEMVNAKAGEEIELSLRQVDQLGTYGRIVTVTPRKDPPEGEGALGVVISSVEMKFFPVWQMPFRGAWFGLKEAIGWGLTIVGALVGMVKDLLIAGVVPKDVAGPVGIYQLTGSVAQAGLLSVFQFVGILSVNLAVLNIMPFPALDGGRLLFLVVEAVTGRRVGSRFEKFSHALGMALLLGLMLLVTLNDVVRLTGSGTIIGLLQQVLPF